MTGTVRLGLVALGLAVAVCGVSLTGGWLGLPPRRDRKAMLPAAHTGDVNAHLTGGPGIEGSSDSWIVPAAAGEERRPAQEWTSVGGMAVGLGVAVLGAWPRRGRPRISS